MPENQLKRKVRGHISFFKKVAKVAWIANVGQKPGLEPVRNMFQVCVESMDPEKSDAHFCEFP